MLTVEKIENAIDKTLRKQMQFDGEDVKVLSVNEETKEVKVELIGVCSGHCSSCAAKITLLVIERTLHQVLGDTLIRVVSKEMNCHS